MLEVLTNDSTRSALLRLFWDEDFEGTVADAAVELVASYGSVHKEVRRLWRAGILKRLRAGKKLLYSRNDDYRNAKVLQALLEASPRVTDSRQANLYRELAARGAFLLARPASTTREPEELFVEAVEVSRRDLTLLRVLPAWLGHELRQGTFDLTRLVELASRSTERHAVGFVLALSATVLRRPALSRAAASLRDHRRREDEPYVLATNRTSSWTKRVARARPKVAREWAFLLDAPLADFAEVVRESQEAA
ncbi:MAG: hypothetical protein AAFV32_07450 [Myxococcota bacterium]